MVRIKRIYEKPGGTDGLRVLVDRLWPRGVTKVDAKIDFWAKNIAPSAALRRWYGHDAGKWQEFKEYYFKELEVNSAGIESLLSLLEAGPVTLVCASREIERSNAAVLKEYLEARLAARSL